MRGDIERVLFDAPDIQKRIDEMAAQITADYSDRELTVIAILTEPDLPVHRRAEERAVGAELIVMSSEVETSRRVVCKLCRGFPDCSRNDMMI